MTRVKCRSYTFYEQKIRSKLHFWPHPYFWCHNRCSPLAVRQNTNCEDHQVRSGHKGNLPGDFCLQRAGPQQFSALFDTLLTSLLNMAMLHTGYRFSCIICIQKLTITSAVKLLLTKTNRYGKVNHSRSQYEGSWRLRPNLVMSDHIQPRKKIIIKSSNL